MRTHLLIGILCLLCFAVIGRWNAGSVNGSQDVGRYREIGAKVIAARAGKIEEIKSEYPPLASAAFVLPYMVSSEEDYGVGWILFLFFCVFCTTIVSASFDRSAVLVVPMAVLFTTILLGPEVTFSRFDILVALLLLFCWYAYESRYYLFSSAALVLSVCLKLTPVLLFPLLFFAAPRASRVRLLEGGIFGASFGTVVPFLVLGPTQFFGNISYLLGYHGGRGIQVESTWSSINMLIKKFLGGSTRIEFHALSLHNMDFPSYAIWLTSLLLFAGIAYMTIQFRAQEDRAADMGLLLSAGLFWMLAVSPVLSPQYYVWVLPLLFAWGIRRILRSEDIDSVYTLGAILLFTVAVATQWIFPWYYGELVDRRTYIAIFILLSRNVLTFVLCGICMVLLQVERIRMAEREGRLRHTEE